MKRILSILILVFCSTAAFAQGGAGLSTGQAVGQTSANPRSSQKHCPHCGITMGNVTYPWQHESWCPYYKPKNSGSSGGGSARVSSGSYTSALASVATRAIGSMLSSAISGSTSEMKLDWGTGQEYHSTKAGRANGNFTVVFDTRADAEGIWNNSSRSWLMKPYKYSKLDISDMNAVIARKYKGGKYGIIDGYSGKEIMPFEYDSAVSFRVKKAPVLLIKSNGEKDKRVWVWNRTLSEEYEDYIIPQKGENIYVGVKKNGKWGVMGMDGKLLTQIEWDGVWLPSVTSVFGVSSDGKWGIFYNGDMVLPAEFSKISVFYNFAICTRDGLKYGAISYKGEQIVPEEYEEIGPFKNEITKKDFFKVKKGDFYGLVGLDGLMAVPAIYTEDKDLEIASASYEHDSYTQFIKRKIGYLTKTKGEFEKTSEFEARQNDPELQRKYINSVLADLEKEFAQWIVATDRVRTISISDYDADNECFMISDSSTPRHNPYPLPVPQEKAKLFKSNFRTMAQEASKGASYRVIDDTLSIDEMSFTLPDGTVYKISK